MPFFKLLKSIFFLLVVNTSTAQRGFLLIKKHNKTIESYSTGLPILFTHHYGYNVQGLLAHIKKDSFSILQYTIQKKRDPMGFVFFDTIYQGYTFFALTDVASFPRRKQKGKLVQMASGASYLASMGIVGLNIVNGIKFKDKFTTIAQYVVVRGGGLGALGFGLSKIYPNDYRIRKKFRLALMQF
jgi:hypothetical protein